MKIDLNTIDRENFLIHGHLLNGETVFLIQPNHIGATWTENTLCQRSVVVNADGEVISASFKKFFNWDEKPDLDPIPSSLKGAQLMEKLDGSTLIFSRYKGQTIIRTRGTIDASVQPLNGHEIKVLCGMYPKFMAWFEMYESSPMSFIFEWTSPLNRIVIDYGDVPNMYLTGIVMHSDYSYFTQGELDGYANQFGFKRPRTFSYDSIEDMKHAVDLFKGVEGLCVYYNEGQSIRKVKGAEYLVKHRMKSELSNIEKVIDLWFIAGRLPYQEFFDYCEKSFDFEIANDARGFISNICDGMKEVEKIMSAMISFVDPLKTLPRKDAAQRIIQAYGTTGRSSMCFTLYDSKPLVVDQIKKLLYQVLKIDR